MITHGPPLQACLDYGGEFRELAWETIARALRAAHGSVPNAAELLGVSERTLHRLLSGEPELARLATDLRRTAGLWDPRNSAKRRT